MINYSQHGEEKLIFDYFGNSKGTFLDIGANDGITFSNVAALYDNGWDGLLVEASPKAYKKLQENYETALETQLLNFAIGNKIGTVDFYESGSLVTERDVSLVSSLHEKELKRWQTINAPGQKVVDFEKIQVQMIDFDTLLALSKYKTFDFISIDIEGGELDLLPQMDFNKLGTKMIIVENNGKDQDKFDAIILPFGFKLIATNKANLIYCK